MNVYVQCVMLYTGYMVIHKMTETISLSKYLLAAPYYLYKFPSKIQRDDLPVINFEKIKKEKIFIFTKRPNYFKMDFYIENGCSDDDEFEKIKLKDETNVGDNPLVLEENIKNLTSFLVIHFDKIIVDFHKLSIFELKIIYDVIFFFLDFKEFLKISKRYSTVVVDNEAKLFKFIQ